MKVLQIAPPWIDIPPHTYGGTEAVIYHLTEELIRLGHEVTLFATKNSTTSAKLEYVYDTGLFHQNKSWSLIQPALALPALLHYDQAFKLAERGGFDVVHAHLSAGTDIMKLKFLADCKVPCLATAHMVFPFDRWSNMDEEFLNYYAHQVKLVFISQTLANLYPNTFDKLGVVHNGLDVDSITYNPSPAGWNSQPYLAWLGKILPWKGLHLAIQAAKDSGQNLVFAGVMDSSDHESQTYFDTKIAPHIDDRQIIYLGPADLALKNKLLGNAYGFLSPILWDEPFGMVTIESLAAGTPVIGFARGGTTEIIQHQKNGFLVPDYRSMVKTIDQLNQINRLDCRKTVEQHFSAQSMTKGYLNIYRQTVKRAQLAAPALRSTSIDATSPS
jgi:glycosyltransferase involved in cell wall biosynthesis